MDVLLSIPVTSNFLSGSVSSLPTSLNLLLFYLTWSTLILSHTPLKVEVLVTAAVRIAFCLLPSLLFLLFDILLPSLSQNLKVKGASAFPPRNARYLARLLGLALFNLALAAALESGASLSLAALLGRPPFRVSAAIPLPWQIAKQVTTLFVLREVLTYYIHRYLLHPRAGTGTTGSRTRQLHDFAATRHGRFAPARHAPPFSLLLLGDHPLPQLLHRLVPVYLSAVTLTLFPVYGTANAPRLHLLTYFVFVALATLEETLGASGYSVVPGGFMGGVARRTTAHYCQLSGGNFGAWGVLDWAHGTSIRRNVVADVRDKVTDHVVSPPEYAATPVEDNVDAVGRVARRREGKKAGHALE